MLKRYLPLLIAIAAVPAALPASEDDGPEKLDIVDTAIEADGFKTLVAAVQQAKLVDALRADGPFTVFAPTDKAFAALPEGTLEKLTQPENRAQLRSILLYHVVPGKVTAIDALQAGKATTLQGDDVRIQLSGGRLKIEGANAVQTDILALNGVIHAIDSVLIPPQPEPAERSPRMALSDLIEVAISRGVPLFNAGQQEACAAIYEITCRAVLELDNGLISDRSRSAIERALARAESAHGAASKAWALRRGLDQVRRELAEEPATSKSAISSPDRGARIVFDFGSDTPPWRPLNDDVMGGISRSSFELMDGGTAVFQGALSLENNGGFATVRSASADLGLGSYDTLVMRVRGDGRTYSLTARPSDRRRGINYWKYEFTTPRGEWTEIEVPLAKLQHWVMGWRVPNSKAIAPDQIRSLAFMIADKNEDPFRLEIDWIKAVNRG